MTGYHRVAEGMCPIYKDLPVICSVSAGMWIFDWLYRSYLIIWCLAVYIVLVAVYIVSAQYIVLLYIV